MPTPWPFTGRVAELERIRRVLAGRGGVVLAGPAGVGKSRLAVRAAESFKPTHAVLRVLATQAARSLPLGALAPLLSTAPPEVNLLGWAAETLLARGSGRSILLVVDDGHLLDPTSAALVHQLAVIMPVLVTVRYGEPCPDAVTALWKEELADRIELGPLSRDETEETLSSALGGPIEISTLDRLCELSQGNLLYLRELVVDALDTGTLSQSGGWWRWRSGPRIAGRLADLIAARIGTLRESERKILELTALGEPIGARILAALASAEAVEAVEERQLIQLSREGRREVVRLSHPLYGEAIRAGCPALRTRRRFRQLAEAIEATGARRREDELRLALWRLESGTTHDPGPLLAACKRAWAAHDYPLAERFGRAAFDAGGGIEAALILATVLNYADRAAEAEAVLASVWDLECDERTRTLLTLTRAHGLAWGGQGRVADADRLLAEVEPTLLELENQQEILILRGVLAVVRGDCLLGLRLSDEVLAAPYSRPLWAQAMLVRTWCQVHTGRCHTALDTAADALACRDAWQEAVPPIVGSFHAAIVDAHRFAGELDALDAAIEQSRAATGEGGWDRTVYHDRIVRGISWRLRGRVAQAAQVMRETIASMDVDGYATVSPAELAIAASQAGDAATAAEALARVERAVASSSQVLVFVPDLARHWVTAAHGKLAEAVEVALAAAARLGAMGLLAAELTVLHDAVRLGAAARVADRLSELTAACEGPLAAACANHARAAAGNDGPALEAAAREFEGLGLILHAAEAFAQASQAFARDGRTASARASAARAGNLAARCGGARTPALARAQAPGLTTRELEVATLAASGMSSKQIADRLVVSVRTVDNHLQSAYAKLGVAGRTELRDVLPG